MTTLHFTVTDQDCAIALGSGDVPVLATPRILAWMEAATIAAAAGLVAPGSTSVGIEVHVSHRRACAAGARIEIEVTHVTEEGRRLAFEVLARERRSAAAGQVVEQEPVLVASGRVIRAIVDRADFLRRL